MKSPSNVDDNIKVVLTGHNNKAIIAIIKWPMKIKIYREV
jgi:hypothetical protein